MQRTLFISASLFCLPLISQFEREEEMSQVLLNNAAGVHLV